MCSDYQMLNPSFASFIVETYLHINYLVLASICSSIKSVNLWINYQCWLAHWHLMSTCASTTNIDLHMIISIDLHIDYQHWLVHQLLALTYALIININLGIDCQCQLAHWLSSVNVNLCINYQCRFTSCTSTINMDYWHQLLALTYKHQLLALTLASTNNVNDLCAHMPHLTNHDL
jgi:hypothetical protein